MTTENLTLEDVRAKAKGKLKGICGVYKICDGDPSRLCQRQSYGGALGIGGLGSGASFTNNVLALKRIKLKMRLIGETYEPDTIYSFLGHTLSMPIMAASTAGVNSFGGDSVITEEEFCNSVIQGCKEAGTMGWRGHSWNYSLENSYGIKSISKAEGWGIKIVKPMDQDLIIRYFEKAKEAGACAVGVDIDGAGSYAMPKHNNPVYRKTPEEIRELVKSTSLPVIIKGIMAVEDAQIATNSGAAAIVVSNHGGRVLDCSPGTAEVLPRIASAVKGKIKIVVDGGIRTGYDVLKMIALGAESVLIGRDVIRAAVGAGAVGVRLQMEHLSETLKKAMIMTGCRNLKEITPDVLEISGFSE
jgi:isopentenyl diphosphate isomerase/L-lactate dehydrogenase-like FMN-dependent dehydrogenase